MTYIYILFCIIVYYCRFVLYFCQGVSSIKTSITCHSVSALASDLDEMICKVLPSSMLSLGLISQDLSIDAQKAKPKNYYLSHQQQN